MGFRDSMRELSGYFKDQRSEGAYRTRLVKKSIKSETQKREYHNFKKATFEKLATLFYDMEYSRVVLVPKGDAYVHFDRLLEDEEFVYYYDGSRLPSGEYSVKRRLLDI